MAAYAQPQNPLTDPQQNRRIALFRDALAEMPFSIRLAFQEFGILLAEHLIENEQASDYNAYNRADAILAALVDEGFLTEILHV